MSTSTINLDLVATGLEDIQGQIAAARFLAAVDPGVTVTLTLSGQDFADLFAPETTGTNVTLRIEDAVVEDVAPAAEEAPAETEKPKAKRFRMTNAEKDAGLTLDQAKAFRAAQEETGVTLSAWCDEQGIGDDDEPTEQEPAAEDEPAGIEGGDDVNLDDLDYERDIKSRVSEALKAGIEGTELKKIAKGFGIDTFKVAEREQWPAIMAKLDEVIAAASVA